MMMSTLASAMLQCNHKRANIYRACVPPLPSIAGPSRPSISLSSLPTSCAILRSTCSIGGGSISTRRERCRAARQQSTASAVVFFLFSVRKSKMVDGEEASAGQEPTNQPTQEVSVWAPSEFFLRSTCLALSCMSSDVSFKILLNLTILNCEILCCAQFQAVDGAVQAKFMERALAESARLRKEASKSSVTLVACPCLPYVLMKRECTIIMRI